MSIVENFGPTADTLGSPFFVGALIGYVLKKVIKNSSCYNSWIMLAGLAYLEYHHQVANINWNKLQTVSEHAITTLQMQL